MGAMIRSAVLLAMLTGTLGARGWAQSPTGRFETISQLPPPDLALLIDEIDFDSRKLRLVLAKPSVRVAGPGRPGQR